jgi:cadmium resistance protein CadD (predicted permease)
MSNLLLILLAIFGGVALMVVLGQRFAKPADPEQMRRLQRWLFPLVGLMLVLSLFDYYF